MTELTEIEHKLNDLDRSDVGPRCRIRDWGERKTMDGTLRKETY
jgi:hypothetical protein